MEWIVHLVSGHSVAQSIVVLCLVAGTGLALGSLKFRGVGLGIAGVLFTGLAFGHFGVKIEAEMAEFIREFGLILFVYTIGMQVGPGFFSSLRRQGAPLNGLAAGIVLLGALLAVAAHKLAGVDVAAMAGLFSGATTNTPSLGAAQEALKTVEGFSPEMAAQPGLAYAIAYPFGVVGIILAMLLLRGLLGIQVDRAEESFRKAREQENPGIVRKNLRVTNPNLDGLRLSQVPSLQGTGVVVSRIRTASGVSVARGDSVLRVGDTVLAVGPARAVDAFRIVVGEPSEDDLTASTGDVQVRRIVVTHKNAIGRSLDSLNLADRYAVRFTRLSRAEVDLPDPTSLRLQAGDTLTVVGSDSDLDAVARELGNSMKDLNHPQVIPLFVGILMGIVLGSLPVYIPGMPAAVKLGLAGGPLVVAILLSYIGRVGPLVWYMPMNANFLLREIGIVMFLSVVGLKSGGRFMETLVAGDGLLWLVWGAAITLIPLLIMGIVALKLMKTNYLTAIGVLAGSMTDPPALAFANSVTSTAAPAISYATVYPLTMLLRVVAAQVLVLVLG